MAFRLLDEVTATGASVPITLRRGVDNHTVHATWTGAPTALTLNLEGSLLNPEEDEWEVLATQEADADQISAQSMMFHVTNKSVRYVRLNLDTLTGGTSPTVTALYEDEKE